MIGTFVAALLVVGGAGSAPGDPAQGFGFGGTVVTDIRNRGQDRCLELLLQPDRRVVCVGFTRARGSQYRDITLARYLSNGRLDPTFGARGITVFDSGLSKDDVATSAAVQRDGKIVVAGVADVPGGQDFLVARFTPQGRIDPKFGVGGFVTTDVGAGDPDLDAAFAVAVQSDGKIVAAGQTTDGPATEDDTRIAIVRYTANGVLDASFGTQGKISDDRGDRGVFALALRIQPDGKIAVGGYALFWGFRVLQYLPDGRPDEEFGTNGIAQTALGMLDTAVCALVLQRDGKLVAVGWGQAGGLDDYAVIVRYRRDGGLDRSFGRGGKAILRVAPGTTEAAPFGAFAATLDSKGRIVVAGASGGRILVGRYRKNGAADRGFGGLGFVTATVRDGAYAYASAVVVQPGGEIIAAGSAKMRRTGEDLALIRLRDRGRPGTRFASFTARTAHRTVIVRWRTTAEVGAHTYVLYRQRSGHPVWVGKVAARGNTGRGTAYTLIDRAALPNRCCRAPWYWLVEQKRDGRRVWYGPVLS